MKILEDVVSKDGNEYHLIERIDDVALYDIYRDNIFMGYTVFIVKEQKETVVKMMNKGIMVDVKLEHKELFPGENKYGTSAWFLGKVSVDFSKTFMYDLISKRKLKKEKKENSNES